MIFIKIRLLYYSFAFPPFFFVSVIVLVMRTVLLLGIHEVESLERDGPNDISMEDNVGSFKFQIFQMTSPSAAQCQLESQYFIVDKAAERPDTPVVDESNEQIAGICIS